jgi:hypothetical protein
MRCYTHAVHYNVTYRCVFQADKTQRENKDETEERDEDKPRADPDLQVGHSLPPRYGDFPPDLYGKPIEDIDEYYHNKYVSNITLLHTLRLMIRCRDWPIPVVLGFYYQM